MIINLSGRLRLLGLTYCLLTLCSCQVLNNSSKYNFVDGYYHSRLNTTKKATYYVVALSDSIKVYPAHSRSGKVDTVSTISIFFPQVQHSVLFKPVLFTNSSFDLDVFTILFKYRSPAKGFPNQLNTGFNGALFCGYRTDFYKLFYKLTPLKLAKRNIAHYGYSVGGFAGLGTARIDEYVTLNRINYQYDGAIITTGIAVELGINKVNFGVNYGFDFLTDKNKNTWINNSKGWVGVSIGLNIN